MSARKRILVVDDEDMILDILSSLLQDDGYDVITAQHPSLAVVACNNIDLIILDLKLSDRNDLEGKRVLGRLWEDECCSIPVIIYSAYVTATGENDFLDEIVRAQGKGRKIFRCIEKGGGVAKLLAAIHDYFDSAEKGELSAAAAGSPAINATFVSV